MMTHPAYQPVLLRQFYRGKWIAADREQSDFIITAASTDLEPEDARRLFSAANFGSYNAASSLDGLTQGYGLLAVDKNNCLLLHVRPGPIRSRGHTYPDYRALIIPRTELIKLSGNLEPLRRLLNDDPSLPEIPPPGQWDLPLLPLTPFEPLSLEQEAPLLQFLYDRLAERSHLTAQLLTALIAGKPVAIIEADLTPPERWHLAQAIILALPPTFRPDVTFATEVFDSMTCPAKLKFLYRDPLVKSGRDDLKFSWSQQSCQPELPVHPYAEFVAFAWRQGPHWLLKILHDPPTTELINQLANSKQPSADPLARLGERLLLDYKLETGTITLQDALLVSQALNHWLNLSQELPENLALSWCKQLVLRLPEYGLGDKVYYLLRDWLKKFPQAKSRWPGTLDEVVEAHRSYLKNENTADSLLAYLSFSLEEQKEYYPLLLDKKTSHPWPEALNRGVDYLSPPLPERRPHPETLIAASRLLPEKQQLPFLFDLAWLGAQQGHPGLLTPMVLQKLRPLTPPKYLEKLQQIADGLNRRVNQINDPSLLTELAQLNMAVGKPDEAVTALACHWQVEHNPTALDKEISNFCQNPRWPDDIILRFRTALDRENFSSETGFQADWCLLQRWQKQEERSQLPNEAIQDCSQRLVTYILEPSESKGGWAQKASQLAKLASLPILKRPDFRGVIPHAITHYARELPLASLQAFHKELNRQSLLKEAAARIAIQQHLGRALGEHNLTRFAEQLTRVVNQINKAEESEQKSLKAAWLNRLRQTKLDWKLCAPELKEQLADFEEADLAKFRANCLFLTGRLSTPKPDPDYVEHKPVSLSDTIFALQTLLTFAHKSNPGSWLKLVVVSGLTALNFILAFLAGGISLLYLHHIAAAVVAVIVVTIIFILIGLIVIVFDETS